MISKALVTSFAPRGSPDPRLDFDDIDLLDDTCPVADLLTYATRITGLQFAATQVVFQILAHQICIQAALGICSPDRSSSKSKHTVAELLQRQAALWRGFVAWCEEKGHDPRQVLSLAPLGVDCANPARAIIEMQIDALETWDQDLPNYPIDPQQVQFWRDAFHAFESRLKSNTP